MKTDLYTKAVLTVIAAMLSVIAANQIVKPTTAHAASDQTTGFAVQYEGRAFYVYSDANGGTVKMYGNHGDLQDTVHLTQP